MTNLGKYSYGMYVLHFPICLYQNRFLLTLAGATRADFHVLLWLGSKLVGVVVSYLLALGSWHLLEKHFLRLKCRFSAAPVTAPALIENQPVPDLSHRCNTFTSLQ